MISFPAIMTNFNCDAYSGATPLFNLKNSVQVNIKDMIIGNTSGTIGETSMLCIVIGAIILFAVGVIDYVIPFSYIVSFVAFVGLFGTYHFNWGYIAAQLAGGGLMLGAIFMATDYVTSPQTAWGKVIFGIGCGVITCVIRFYANYAEGVSFSILIMNILTPYIDRFTETKPLGAKTKEDTTANAKEGQQ